MTRWNLIAVGVDGSAESRKALQWACAEAQAHEAEVLAVSTWTPPPVPIDPPFGSFPWGAGTATDSVTEVGKMLTQIVEEVGAAFPGLTIRQHVEAGNAASELIQLSDQADLIVVGARGHGGFTGMLLGSVSQHVLAHSRCTVAVVR